MWKRTLLGLTIAAGLLLAGQTTTVAAADDSDNEKESPYSLEISFGSEYDSNVAVLDLDASSGEGDVAALIDLGLGFNKNLTDKLKFKLGYDFSQSLHEEFDTFDIRIHRGSTELAYDFGRTDAGATFQYADASLDDDGYLVLQRTSPYVSRLFGKRLFLRLAYAHSDKEFTTSPERDATRQAWSTDAFVFLDGVKRYLVFGYEHQDEDAEDDQFDYDGGRLKAQYSHRFARGERQTKLKVGLRYEFRDYNEPTVSLAERREDDRYGLTAELEVPLFKHWFLKPRCEYNDNDSNLTSVDFDEYVVSVELGAKF